VLLLLLITAYALKTPMEPSPQQMSHVHASLVVQILLLQLDPLPKLLAHALPAPMDPITVLKVLAHPVLLAVPVMLAALPSLIASA